MCGRFLKIGKNDAIVKVDQNEDEYKFDDLAGIDRNMHTCIRVPKVAFLRRPTM